MTRSLLVSLLFVCLAAANLRAENWPQWRGMKNDGMSAEKNLPTKWTKDDKELIRWRLAMPGPAGSTPVIWGDKIFLTSIAGDDLVLLCVSTSGQELWRQLVSSGNKDVRGDEGNSASPSPSTDGEHVWCFFTNGTLACYTVDGKEVWKFNVQDRYGKFSIQFGMTSTPVLDGDRLYLQLIHGEGKPETREATIVCLEKATGKEVWKVGRPSDGRDECEHSYASPLVYRDAQREFLLTHGADYTVAHSLKDGSELWRLGDLNPKGNYNNTLRFVSSPVAVPGCIVIPSAKNGPVVCVHPEGSGNITEQPKFIFWKKDRGTPDVPSPLVVDGLVYLLRENGNFVCLDEKTGEQHYEERTVQDRHRASPLFADGKIYTVGRKGVVCVLKPGPKFELLSKNDMGESTSSSPIVSGGRLYLRTFDALYAIGAK